MATPTQLSILIQRALESLEDTSVLHEPRTWYRNGPRGAVHNNRYCHKYVGNYDGGEQFESSFAEIAGKRQCGSCCTDDILPPNLGRILDSLTRVRENMLTVDNLDEKSSVLSIGLGLHRLSNARLSLARLDESEIDQIASTHKKLQKRLGDESARLQKFLAASADQLPEVCASNYLLRKVARNEAVPGAKPDDAGIFGSTAEVGDSLQHVFVTWAKHRRHGSDAARERTNEALSGCRLSSVRQLDFTADAAAEITLGENILLGARRRWRAEVEKRLHARLMPYWETLWQTASSREPRLIGLRTPFTQGESYAALYSYPHRFTAGGEHCLILAPYAVCRWLDVEERRWSGGPEIADACTIEHLDVIAALWDPKDASSSFHDLSAAREAAEQLERA